MDWIVQGPFGEFTIRLIGVNIISKTSIMPTCDRCGYTTESTFGLHQHYGRKNPCPARISTVSIAELVARDFPATITSHQCDKCGNYFASPQSKWNHSQRCRITSVVACLVPFGQERIDVDCDGFKSIMLEYMKRTNEPVDMGLYIKYKFFDDARPENHTLRRQRRIDKYLEYYDGQAWRQDSFENVAGIAMFEGFPGRDRYLTRDGERYMFSFRFMMNVGFPFRFAQLAALIAECDDMDYDVDGQREFRDGTIAVIADVVHKFTTAKESVFDSRSSNI